MTDFQFFLPIAKVDKEKRTVSGYASTPTKDSDGEIITLDAIRHALPDYMTYGNIREMHALKAVGTAEEANIDTKGLFLTAKIVDDAAWNKCLQGVYKGFSIGGKKLDKTGDKITAIAMTEISVVDRPANPDCRITIAKSAKKLGEAEGHLVKWKPKDEKTVESKALAKMAKIVGSLAKANPPAAQDGFSLPAKQAKKSEASPNDSRPDENETRKAADDVEDDDDDNEETEGDAEGQSEAKKPKKAKKAKKMAKASAKATLAKALGLRSNLSFLDLTKAKEPFITSFVEEEKTMTKTVEKTEASEQHSGDPIADAIATLMKKAALPSRMQRMAMAKQEVKNCRKAAKTAREAIEEAHKMHKAAYLNKAAKKDDKGADGDFDHAGAMEKLQKAYGEIDKARTFGKAAMAQIAKAESIPGRSGQRGQEVNDSEGDYYSPPKGVKDLSPGEMSSAGPGGGTSGSQPPLYPVDGGVFPGKADGAQNDLAKFAKNGNIPAEVVELIMAKARTEGELEALRRIPMGNTSRGRPFAFDMNKVMGGNQGAAPNGNSVAINKALFDGVDTNALGSGDERSQTEASARVIGNFITSGHFGKSVFDPAFKGAAGTSR